MCWILNGKTLAKNCSLDYFFKRKDISINIELPYTTNHSNNYNMDELKYSFLESEFFYNLKANTSFYNFYIDNGNLINIQFDSEEYMASIVSQVRRTLLSIMSSQTNTSLALNIMKEIRIITNEETEDSFKNISFTKKYWRTFIDKMEKQIFIDNIKGLDIDYIYYY